MAGDPFGLMASLALRARGWLTGESSSSRARGRGGADLPPGTLTPIDDLVRADHIPYVQHGATTTAATAAAAAAAASSTAVERADGLIVPVGKWTCETLQPEARYDVEDPVGWVPSTAVQIMDAKLLRAGQAVGSAGSGGPEWMEGFVARTTSGDPIAVLAAPAGDDPGSVVAVVSCRRGHAFAKVVSQALPLFAVSVFGAAQLTARSFTSLITPSLDVDPASEVRVTDSPGWSAWVAAYRALLEREAQSEFKIGVLAVFAGQTDESDILANDTMPGGMTEFLDAIASRVSMDGFSGYRGGLDTSPSGHTGPESYYTTTAGGAEIMLHVGPMLPRDPHSDQQLLRKRHIGNDVVLVVFLEEGAGSYVADTLTCQFNHVIFAVSPAEGAPVPGRFVRIAVAHAHDVPYRPPLGARPSSPDWPDAPLDVYDTHAPWFADWFTVKMVAAETAALQTSQFDIILRRTRAIYLDELLAAAAAAV